MLIPIFMEKKYRSLREKAFRFVIMLIVVLWVIYIYIQINIAITNGQIARNQEILAEKNQELDKLFQTTGFDTLIAIQEVQSEVHTMQWSDRIQSLIDMIVKLESVSPQDSTAISLSDFRISFEELSLRWKVSSLSLLYVDAPSRWFQSLIDRFTSLDFISHMRIQEYTRDDIGAYNFILQADITHDESK
jgi:hypothetical protein